LLQDSEAKAHCSPCSPLLSTLPAPVPREKKQERGERVLISQQCRGQLCVLVDPSHLIPDASLLSSSLVLSGNATETIVVRLASATLERLKPKPQRVDLQVVSRLPILLRESRRAPRSCPVLPTSSSSPLTLSLFRFLRSLLSVLCPLLT
jgi:hypothetical protein